MLDYYESTLTEKRKQAIGTHIAWWRREIGSKRLSDATTAVLAACRDKLTTEPYLRAVLRKAVVLTPRRIVIMPTKSYRRTPTTANRYVEAIAHAFTIARREKQWIAINPAFDVSALREPHGRVGYLTNAERVALLASCEAQRSDLHALVALSRGRAQVNCSGFDGRTWTFRVSAQRWNPLRTARGGRFTWHAPR